MANIPDEAYTLFPQLESDYGLPPGTIGGLIEHESGWRPRPGPVIPSMPGTRADGYGQWLPGTAQRYGVEVGNLASEAEGIARYLSDLTAKKGSFEGALATYGGHIKADPTNYITDIKRRMGKYAMTDAGPIEGSEAELGASRTPAAEPMGSLADALYAPQRASTAAATEDTGSLADALGTFERYEPAPPKAEERGAMARGAITALKQIPQTLYGVGAGLGAVAESVFGEGGVATDTKDHWLKKYQEAGKDIEKDAKETDSLTYSYNKAVDEGDFGAMVEWLKYGIGSGGIQALTALASGGVGAAVGKATATTLAEKVAAGMVAREVEAIAATAAGKTLAAEEISKLAVKNAAATIGQNVAIAAQSFGMEGGEIFGELAQKGKVLTGEEIARGLGATLAAGGLEFVGDKFGVDLLMGKSGVFKPAAAMEGLKGRAARAGIGVAAAAPLGAGQEYLQTGLEEYGKGKEEAILPWMQSAEAQRKAIDAAGMGFVGGALPGAVGGMASSPERVLAAPTVDEAIDQAKIAVDAYAAPDAGTLLEDQAAVRQAMREAQAGMTPADRLIEQDTPPEFGASTEQESGRAYRQQQAAFDAAEQQATLQKDAELDLLRRDALGQQADVAPAVAAAAGVDAPVQTAMQLAMESAKQKKLVADERQALLAADAKSQAMHLEKLAIQSNIKSEEVDTTYQQQETELAMQKARDIERGMIEERFRMSVENPEYDSPTAKGEMTALQLAMQKALQTQRQQAGDKAQTAINTAAPKFSTERDTIQAAIDAQATEQNKYPAQVEVVPITAFGGEATQRDGVFKMMTQSTAQTIRNFGKAIGREVVFYRSTDTIDANREKGLADTPGGFAQDGKIYIRADHRTEAVSPLAILGHEWLHGMRESSQELYGTLKDAIVKSGTLKDGALNNFYRDYYGYSKDVTDATGTTADGLKTISDADIATALADKTKSEHVLEEFVADLSGNRFTEHGFWMDVFENVESKPLIVRIGRALTGFIDKLMGKESFKKFAADTDVANLKAVRSAVTGAMVGYMKQQGTPAPVIAEAVYGKAAPTATDRLQKDFGVTLMPGQAEPPVAAPVSRMSVPPRTKFSGERSWLGKMFGKKDAAPTQKTPVPTEWEITNPTRGTYRAYLPGEFAMPYGVGPTPEAAVDNAKREWVARDPATREQVPDAPAPVVAATPTPEAAPNRIPDRPAKDNHDPMESEATEVQTGVEGKSMLDAAMFIVANGLPHEVLIADKVLKKLTALQNAGVKLTFTVAHVGDSVPRSLANGARGITDYRFGKDSPSLDVWVNGADVTGRVGTSYEVVLHELVHAATMGAVRLGNLKVSMGSQAQQNVTALYDVTNAVIDHFNQRVRDSKSGKVELTKFEQDKYQSLNNAFVNPNETLAWALTNADAQTYLESIPYQGKTMWTRLVEQIRVLLGLSPRSDTALSEVLRISEVLLDDNINELKQAATASGTSLAVNQASDRQIATTANFSTERIGDASKTQYTKSQLATFRKTGRTVEVPTLKEQLAALQKDFGKKLTQGLVDQFAPVKDFSQYAYRLLRQTKGIAGAVEVLLNYGKLSIKDGTYDGDKTGGFVQRIGVPLQGHLGDFLWWIAGNRAEKLLADGRENLMDATDIQNYKNLANGEIDFDYTIQNGPKKGQTTRNKAEMFRDAHITFNGFVKNVLDIAEQSKTFSKESRKEWEQEFYVPFFRVSEDEGRFVGGEISNAVVRQKAIEYMKGGKGKLNYDIVETTLANWAHILDASSKNRAAAATLESTMSMGAAKPVGTWEQYRADPANYAAPDAKNTVWYLGEVTRTIPAGTAYTENGVDMVSDGTAKITSIGKIHVEVTDPLVLAAVSSLEYAGFKNPLMKAMGTMKHVLTIGVTASPAFKVRNLIRDSIQSIAVSNIGANPLTNMRQGWAASDLATQTYVSMLASGATIRFGMSEGNMADHVRRLIDNGVDSSTILDTDDKLQHVWGKMKQGWDAYNEIGNRGETINRAALYEQLITGKKDAKGNWLVKPVSHGEAALQARDLMDFSMQGSYSWVRFLTQVVPFMNARMQGMYKLGKEGIAPTARTLVGKGSQEDKAKAARFSAVFGAVAVAAIGAMLYYQDDEDWKKRDDSDRDNFLWFKHAGIAYRVPMPFEIGAMATVAMRGVELFSSPEMTGQRFKERMWKITTDNLAMNVVPQLFKPMSDVYTNKDSFTGAPIEKMGMDKLQPEHRVTSSTSAVAKGISTVQASVERAMGVDKLVGVASPVQIDHLIRGYFGWLGTFVVGAGDFATRSGSWDAQAPDRDWLKFATQGIVQDATSPSSRYVTQMYNQAKTLEEAYHTHRTLIKEGKAEEAVAFREKYAEELRKYPQVENVKRKESLYNERIRMIERNKNLDGAEKREQILAIQQMKSRLAQTLAPGI